MTEQRQLPDPVKRYIVEELARFKRPSEIVKALQEVFDIDWVTARAVHGYDPTKSYYDGGAVLEALFKETRKAYVERTEDMAVANQVYRLKRLQSMSEAAEAEGKIALAAQLLEQAAKDCGGIFTNVRNIQGELNHNHRRTPEEAREIVAAAIERQKAERGETKH